MAPITRDMRALYRRRAKRYDAALWLYRAAGFHISQYRRLTVNGLALRTGATVVDLGCGTGLNFPLLQEAVGNGGRIIGVDLTDAMLEQAAQRIQKAGWQNVRLVQADMASYEFEAGLDGIVSTLAITLVPEYDAVIRRGASALRHGGRLAVLDLKRPRQWPEWLVRVGAWVNSPYGVTLELATRHPWESIRRHLHEVEFREFYFGALYLSVGDRVDGGTGKAV
jgi:ubiquinone/menaquinone biosynthesis C-methylase UbiE